MERTTVEDDEDLEDLALGEKESEVTSRAEENTARKHLAKAEEAKMGSYVEALKRIEDIERELRGVEGQILIKKRKFSS